jgi:hypothetical protein
MNILIRDEQLNGTVTNEFEIEIENEMTSARELIEKRVIHEVGNYNKKLPEYFHGLVEPTEAEKTLNGFKLKKRQLIDPEKQVYVALDSFMKNGFFILVDNHQIEDINQVIKLTGHSKVSFLKLTPLIGG